MSVVAACFKNPADEFEAGEMKRNTDLNFSIQKRAEAKKKH